MLLRSALWEREKVVEAEGFSEIETPLCEENQNVM